MIRLITRPMPHPASRLFLRPILAMSLAASIALSPVAATPARAGGDAGKVIGALIVLGLIGAAIHNSDVQATPRPRPDPRSHKRLPAGCMKTFETRFGSETFVGRNCLERNFRHWASLPQQCALTIRTPGSRGHDVRRAVYQPRCLRQHGFRIGRNR